MESTNIMSHIDLASIAIAIIASVIGFFIVRTLRLVDSNMQVLYDRLTKIEKDLYMLQGEHRAMQGICGRVCKEERDRS